MIRLLAIGLMLQVSATVLAATGNPGASAPQAEDQRVINDFARCVVKIRPRSVEAAIKTFPGSAEASNALGKVLDPACMPDGEVNPDPILLRGGLYEALYEAEFGTRGPLALPAGLKVDYAQGSDLTKPAEAGQVVLRQFADCVVRANTGSAHRLVLSKVGSTEEEAAFDALAPTLGPCLQKDATIKVSRPVLRSLIAETLYRLSIQARAQMTQGAESA